MRKPNRVEKVWVVTWPKGTTEEWKNEPGGPKNFQSIPVETFLDFKFDLYENGEWRNVIGGCQAVFCNKKEAIAWMEADGGNKCFSLRPAHLSIY